MNSDVIALGLTLSLPVDSRFRGNDGDGRRMSVRNSDRCFRSRALVLLGYPRFCGNSVGADAAKPGPDTQSGVRLQGHAPRQRTHAGFSQPSYQVRLGNSASGAGNTTESPSHVIPAKAGTYGPHMRQALAHCHSTWLCSPLCSASSNRHSRESGNPRTPEWVGSRMNVTHLGSIAACLGYAVTTATQYPRRSTPSPVIPAKAGIRVLRNRQVPAWSSPALAPLPHASATQYLLVIPAKAGIHDQQSPPALP